MKIYGIGKVTPNHDLTVECQAGLKQITGLVFPSWGFQEALSLWLLLWE